MMKPLLIPQPRTLRLRHGAFHPSERLRIFLGPAAGDSILHAALGLSNAFKAAGQSSVTVDRAPPTLSHPQRKGQVLLQLEPSPSPEAYRLTVSAHQVNVQGFGAPGLFYGIQTLEQLVRQYGPRLPCLFIRDEPALAHRGYYLDVTRGKVPTLATLKRLVDRLSKLKYNQLQLYIEHVFDFASDPTIGEGSDPLRPEEILALDAYCRDRFIEFVPSLACFGHMGRILSLPQYRSLAEVEWPAQDWHHATWRQRLRGATVNPRAPRTRKLFTRLLADFLPLFSSGHFNICADETYDLGRGKNARHAAHYGIGRLYLDHIRFLRETAAHYGKRIMFWGDMLLQHRDAIPDTPEDCIILDWGYERDTPFDKVGAFLDAGLEAYVCPATRGYGLVFHAVEEARANIAGYAREGARRGASGLLLTDWGDMGHFNALACSTHALALGAAMSWNPEGESGGRFDRAFSLQVCGDRSGEVAAWFREAGATGLASWPYLIGEADLPGRASHPRGKTRDIQRQARQWAKSFAGLKPSALIGAQDLEELSLACEAIGLNATKYLLSNSGAGGKRGERAKALRAFTRQIADFTRRYGEAWLAANRPAGLDEIARALQHEGRRVARSARGSSGGKRSR